MNQTLKDRLNVAVVGFSDGISLLLNYPKELQTKESLSERIKMVVPQEQERQKYADTYFFSISAGALSHMIPISVATFAALLGDYATPLVIVATYLTTNGASAYRAIKDSRQNKNPTQPQSPVQGGTA